MKQFTQLSFIFALTVLVLVTFAGVDRAKATIIDLTFTDFNPKYQSFGPETSYPLELTLNANNQTGTTWTAFHIWITKDPAFPDDNISNVLIRLTGSIDGKPFTSQTHSYIESLVFLKFDFIPFIFISF